MPGHLLLTFAPATVYLLVVTSTLLLARRCPTWLHPLALILGLPARVLVDGWADPLIACGVAVVLFALGVLATARLLSGVTLFTMCTALALLPFYNGWLGVLGGLALAAVVSVWRTARTSGMGRVNLLTFETMSAFEVLPGGALTKPDLNMLPTREDAETAQEAATVASGKRAPRKMYLPPYLLVGVLAAVAASAVLGAS